MSSKNKIINQIKNMLKVAVFGLAMVCAVCSIYLIIEAMFIEVFVFFISIAVITVFAVSNSGVLL